MRNAIRGVITIEAVIEMSEIDDAIIWCQNLVQFS